MLKIFKINFLRFSSERTKVDPPLSCRELCFFSFRYASLILFPFWTLRLLFLGFLWSLVKELCMMNHLPFFRWPILFFFFVCRVLCWLQGEGEGRFEDGVLMNWGVFKSEEDWCHFYSRVILQVFVVEFLLCHDCEARVKWGSYVVVSRHRFLWNLGGGKT